MKISFLGAVRTTTGSMHLLEVNGSRILLECGLYQGRRQESFERNRHLPFDAESIDCCVLSHAHIDHSGNIPNLVRLGFKGNIYATHATRDLCSAMLRDSAHIQEYDVAYINKRRQRQGKPPVEPIYTHEDTVASLQQFVSVDYDRWLFIAPGVRLAFRDAGHILGSAVCLLDIEEDGGHCRLAFTGDLGRPNMPILRDPMPISEVDYLITESTYGARLHETPEEAESKLRKTINQTFDREGKVIIPSFAVGRTQELVYALQRLSEARKIPRLPIFVDSPLAIDVTEIFRLHPECYDDEILTYMREADDQDPFGFETLRYTRAVSASKELNFLRQSAVIISASGMAEHGRILHHLKNNIEDGRNTVLIVGFQAPNTLGRRLVEKENRVRIFGKEYERRARVEVINGYSAHADRRELLDYFQRLEKERLQRIFIVHGEHDQSLGLQEGLQESGFDNTYIPSAEETVEISLN
jgi:metallo-beta-lactamase family protein